MTEYASKPVYDKIIDRLAQLEQGMIRVNKARDNITRYFRRDLHWDTAECIKGGFLGDGIYEGTAPWAARIAATCFQGLSASKSTPWLAYEMDEQDLRGIDRLDEFCQNVRDHMTSVYQKSNYYDIAPEFDLDGWTIGSPVMFGEEIISEEKIVWMPQHYNNVFMSYDKFNRPNGIIVKDKHWTAQQIVDEFCAGKTPEERARLRKEKLSISLNRALDSGQYNQEFTIIRAVFKRTDDMWTGFDMPKLEDRAGWVSVHFEEGLDATKKNKPLNVKPYFTRPFVSWDFNKKFYGACSMTPAFDAIWDVLSAQQMYKNILENARLQNAPPLYGLSSMENRVDALAGGYTGMSAQEYNTPPKKLDIIGDIGLTREELQLLDEKVERHFHLDSFRKFNNLIRTNKQPVTALQIWQMAGEDATLLSPIIETRGRCITDIDERMVGIEFEAHRGPFDLETLANITDIVVENSKKKVRGIGITPKFVGPMYQAQKVQQVVEPLVRSMQSIQPVFEMFPMTKNIIKEYKLADKILGATDFPADVINTEEDYNAIVEGIQKQQAAQQQQMLALETMKASKGITGKVDDSSILANMVGANAQ
jgi:hypothetical protein